ncbi:MAG: GxxExxY protein [Candidatus Aureabacteria bacterium]|nr:GxxExxY protein [Candidatus Auribacterota bacterium]
MRIAQKNILNKDLSDKIIGAALNVYNILGRGFLEKVYENALCLELKRSNIPYECQKQIKVLYREQMVGDYISDIVVDNKIILEVKATLETPGYHEAQILNYLKATGFNLGYLLNFGSKDKLYFKRFVFSV